MKGQMNILWKSSAVPYNLVDIIQGIKNGIFRFSLLRRKSFSRHVSQMR
jgi:hypothetical protein